MDEPDEEPLLEKSWSLTPGVYYPKNSKMERIRKRSFRNRTERAITKNGDINVEKPCSQKFKFLINWFMTMVETRWRWTLLNFFMAFTLDWLFFAAIYWIIVNAHGDLLDEVDKNNITLTPCIENIHGFTSTFLFSIEVHTTVAYGHRAITLECPQAIFAMCMQCIVSSIFQAFMVGILFAKLTRPKARTQTMLFSKNAVINLRDEKMCLMFRVGDMRKSRILNIKAAAFLVKHDEDDVGSQIELKVAIDDCESMFFLWPVTVKHVIDENSPLHTYSAADFLCEKFEILVIFEGIIESTGQPVQARSSYVQNEIMWGHRFVPIVNYDDGKEVYEVDFSKLSDTQHIDVPLCSTYELDSVIETLSDPSPMSSYG